MWSVVDKFCVAPLLSVLNTHVKRFSQTISWFVKDVLHDFVVRFSHGVVKESKGVAEV